MKFKVRLADVSFSHCGFSNNPMPPVRESKFIEWDRDVNYPGGSALTFVTDRSIPILSEISERPLVAWLLEPRELIPDVYDWVYSNASRFVAILTHEVDRIGSDAPVMWVPFGGCWVPDSEWGLSDDLDRRVSMFVSHKRQLQGHVLRHEIVEEARLNAVPLVLYGSGVGNPVEPKHEHMTHQFQVVVENSLRRGYFTEKLIDCFAKGIVPIYWGCPDLERYGFDERGLIRLYDAGDIKRAYDQAMNMDVDSDEVYAARKHNMETARRYALAEDYMANEYPILLQ